MLSKAREWKLVRELPRIALEEEYGREMMVDGETEKRLLAAAVQPCHDIIIIVQDTGMRPEREVLPMRWEYVDWSNKRYFVYSSKTRAGRRFVPISDRMERVLLSRFAGQKSGWIFPAKKSSSWSDYGPLSLEFCFRERPGAALKFSLLAIRAAKFQ